MNLRIVVNVMDDDEAGTTTYRLAAAAINMGHEVWVMSTGHLAYNPNDTIGAFARTVPQGHFTSKRFLDAFKSDEAIDRRITLDDLDVLLLRSNPSVQQAWAQSAGIHFGRLAMRRAELTDTMFQLAEIVRPRLVEDGLFLVGLDIVGDKMMELNVFTPGGLESAQEFEKVNFTHAVLDVLQRKVQYVNYYRRNFSHVEMAML